MECGRAVWREQADIEWEGSSEKNGWYVKVRSKDISKIVKKKLKRIKKRIHHFQGRGHKTR